MQTRPEGSPVLVVSPNPLDSQQGVEKFCHMLVSALNSCGIGAVVVSRDAAKHRQTSDQLVVTSGDMGIGVGGPRVHVYHGCAAVQVPVSYPDASWHWRLRYLLQRVGGEAISGLGATRVAVSQGCSTEIREKYGLGSVVIPNAVDTEVFAPMDRGAARARLGWSANSSIALFVGRAEVRKRPDIAMDAARLLSYECLHAGMRPHVGMEWVGNLTQDQLALAMAGADVIYLPSLYEANSLAVLESLAVGTPTVTTRTGFVFDLIEAVPGYEKLTAPPGDKESFIAAARLVRDDLDRVEEVMATVADYVRSEAGVDQFTKRWARFIQGALGRAESR